MHAVFTKFLQVRVKLRNFKNVEPILVVLSEYFQSVVENREVKHSAAEVVVQVMKSSRENPLTLVS